MNSRGCNPRRRSTASTAGVERGGRAGDGMHPGRRGGLVQPPSGVEIAAGHYRGLYPRLFTLFASGEPERERSECGPMWFPRRYPGSRQWPPSEKRLWARCRRGHAAARDGGREGRIERAASDSPEFIPREGTSRPSSSALEKCAETGFRRAAGGFSRCARRRVLPVC